MKCAYISKTNQRIYYLPTSFLLFVAAAKIFNKPKEKCKQNETKIQQVFWYFFSCSVLWHRVFFNNLIAVGFSLTLPFVTKINQRWINLPVCFFSDNQDEWEKRLLQMYMQQIQQLSGKLLMVNRTYNKSTCNQKQTKLIAFERKRRWTLRRKWVRIFRKIIRIAHEFTLIEWNEVIFKNKNTEIFIQTIGICDEI